MKKEYKTLYKHSRVQVPNCTNSATTLNIIKFFENRGDIDLLNSRIKDLVNAIEEYCEIELRIQDEFEVRK